MTNEIQQRYSKMIDEVIQATLKGQIRSEAQVQEWIVREVEMESQGIFEQTLSDRFSTTQTQAEDSSDELKQAKAMRSLRALKLLQSEWKKYQESHQSTNAIASATQAILAAPSEQRLLEWIRATDPNQDNPFTADDLKHLARSLHSFAQFNPSAATEIEQLEAGTKRGLEASEILAGHLFEWMYESQRQAGFAAQLPESRGPWKLWATKSHSTLLKQLFQTLAETRSLSEWTRQYPFDLADFVELTIALRTVQRRLITWFERQPYDSQFGTQAAIATHLTFAAIDCQLAQGMADANRRTLEQGCFQVVLQLLRDFAQRPYFPLYGGVLALLSGEYLRDTLSYLDEPLRQAEGTQSKARILTLLGYSYRTAGLVDRASEFHQQALEIAQSQADRPCEIANLNHLSRLAIAQKHYSEALRYSQQALILSRQSGDTLGKTHALTNVGCAEVLELRTSEHADPDAYATAIDYLQQGLKLSETLSANGATLGETRQCQSLCHNSLGIAYVALEQWLQAIEPLRKGVELAQQAGDTYLQGLNFTYLAEAYYGLGEPARAGGAAGLGMYLLEQIGAAEWRQAAGLLLVLQGQMGKEELWAAIAGHRSQLITLIGVDGYDHLPQLLQAYQEQDY